MNCDPNSLVCQVERVADSLDQSDWNTFWSTLIATLVGAVVAAVFSILLYRHEAKTRRSADVDDAVITLMRAIQTYSQSYRKFIRNLDARSQQSPLAIKQGWAERVPVVEEPDRADIDTAIESLVVLTDRQDRIVAERTRAVLYELSFLKDAEVQSAEYASVRRVLVAWRSRKRSTQDTLSSLSIVDERRQRIEKGEPLDQLPNSPEPYVREH